MAVAPFICIILHTGRHLVVQHFSPHIPHPVGFLQHSGLSESFQEIEAHGDRTLRCSLCLEGPFQIFPALLNRNNICQDRPDLAMCTVQVDARAVLDQTVLSDAISKDRILQGFCPVPVFLRRTASADIVRQLGCLLQAVQIEKTLHGDRAVSLNGGRRYAVSDASKYSRTRSTHPKCSLTSEGFPKYIM